MTTKSRKSFNAADFSKETVFETSLKKDRARFARLLQRMERFDEVADHIDSLHEQCSALLAQSRDVMVEIAQTAWELGIDSESQKPHKKQPQ
ncbi:MAG: hypothetical protein DWQ45_12875 [Planctomycetota bacterium]|nr:MAG: hypothetical protein DWQ45_22190 [Planctomycetota bacterium]REK34708.1 MAG: hypothetical protein DWQ45_12875 [Planctomycetota bacterium]